MPLTLCSRCGGLSRRNGSCFVCSAVNHRSTPAIFGPLVFRNPDTGYEKKLSAPGFFCFLFGVFYLGYQGLWRHTFLLFVVVLLGSIYPALYAGTGVGPELIAGLLTAGAVFTAWVWYPLAVRDLLREEYQGEKGWQEVTLE